MTTVSVNRFGQFMREDDARNWLRQNATGNGRWHITAWRNLPDFWQESEGDPLRISGYRTLGLVEFADETDATLFAIWSGGVLV